MEAESPEATRRAAELERQAGSEAPPCLDIEIDERIGAVRVRDPRLFQARRRNFCKRLLEAVSEQPGVRRAEVDLSTASCQIEFESASSTPQVMAGVLVDAVHEASAADGRGGRNSWWRRPRSWSSMTAFPGPEGVSTWETVIVQPGRVRLRHVGLTTRRARLARVAERLADLDGVLACAVVPFSRQLTVDFQPEGLDANQLLDRVQQALDGHTSEALRERSNGACPARANPHEVLSAIPMSSRLGRSVFLRVFQRGNLPHRTLRFPWRRVLTRRALTVVVLTVIVFALGLAVPATALLVLIVVISYLSVNRLARSVAVVDLELRAVALNNGYPQLAPVTP
jgi:hypothetical protein